MGVEELGRERERERITMIYALLNRSNGCVLWDELKMSLGRDGDDVNA